MVCSCPLRALLLSALPKVSNDERSGFRQRTPTLCDTVGAMTSTPSRRRGTSRRGFLAGAGLALIGGGAGVGAGLLVDRSPDAVHVPDPKLLLAAVHAEQELIASIDDTLDSGPKDVPAALLQTLRADHQAHLSALLATVAVVLGAASPTVSAAPRRPGRLLSREQFRMLEAAGAKAAAARALGLTGRDAALVASISACEASHAELLG
jgi:hypothetical protein